MPRLLLPTTQRRAPANDDAPCAPTADDVPRPCRRRPLLPNDADAALLPEDDVPHCCSLEDDAPMHLSPVSAGRPWNHHRDLIAFNFLFRDPIASSFFFPGLDCFLFLVQGLVCFLFSVQGSLCKFFDSQPRQPTKQHLSLACLNTPDLPNI
jgi:hypothetical protein